MSKESDQSIDDQIAHTQRLIDFTSGVIEGGGYGHHLFNYDLKDSLEDIMVHLKQQKTRMEMIENLENKKGEKNDK